MEFKQQPNALKLEEAILGSLIIDNRAIDEVFDLLISDVFFEPKHKIIFEAISNLKFKNSVVDLFLVSNELKRISKLELAGGDFYLIQLTQKISSSAHIEFHSRIILQKYIQRKIIENSNKQIENAYQEDCDAMNLLDEYTASVKDLEDLILISAVSNFKSSVENVFDKSKFGSVKSSFKKINFEMGGYENTDLIILGARPGMGKTSYILNEILGIALNGEPVLFFSLEMNEKQIILRLISIISRVDISNIRRNILNEWEQKEVTKAQILLKNLPIFIDDLAGISDIELRIKAKKLKKEKGIKMIFVDYLGLMTTKQKTQNREQEISKISASLKKTAKDLNLPVMALSQLSRSVENRGGSKRPTMSDLRDSGSIEQDADIIQFLYRPEYYNIDIWDDNEQSPTTNQTELITAKYRNGEPFIARLGCELKFMRFFDIEYLGQDIQEKYYRNENIKKTEMQILPKLNPNDVFENYNDTPF